MSILGEKEILVKSFLLFIAYACIWTTPIGVGYLLWVLWVILNSDFTFLTLTTSLFLEEHLPWLKAWIYSWFWNAWLDFWWSFPAFILGTVKVVANTILGFWLLPIAKRMP